MTVHCQNCGCVIDTKRRSVSQLNRYFALIRAAFTHWPESHDTQFADETEARKWLQIQAGHRTAAARIPIAGVNRDRLAAYVETILRAADSYAIPVVHGQDLVIFIPKSISFQKLGHLDACALFDDVAAVIEAETGLKADQLLKETEAAASAPGKPQAMSFLR